MFAAWVAARAATARVWADAARGCAGACDAAGADNQPASAVAPVTTVAAAFQFTCTTRIILTLSRLHLLIFRRQMAAGVDRGPFGAYPRAMIRRVHRRAS